MFSQDATREIIVHGESGAACRAFFQRPTCRLTARSAIRCDDRRRHAQAARVGAQVLPPPAPDVANSRMSRSSGVCGSGRPGWVPSCWIATSLRASAKVQLARSSEAASICNSSRVAPGVRGVPGTRAKLWWWSPAIRRTPSSLSLNARMGGVPVARHDLDGAGPVRQDHRPTGDETVLAADVSSIRRSARDRGWCDCLQ